jgi:hypothetical protein
VCVCEYMQQSFHYKHKIYILPSDVLPSDKKESTRERGEKLKFYYRALTKLNIESEMELPCEMRMDEWVVLDGDERALLQKMQIFHALRNEGKNLNTRARVCWQRRKSETRDACLFIYKSLSLALALYFLRHATNKERET